MALIAATHTRTVSVTDATARGVAGLVRDAEAGDEIIVERHGRPVAAVVSVPHLTELRQLRDDLNAAALVLARQLSDSGNRTNVDDAIEKFGLSRSDLEAELADDLSAGRE